MRKLRTNTNNPLNKRTNKQTQNQQGHKGVRNIFSHFDTVWQFFRYFPLFLKGVID